MITLDGIGYSAAVTLAALLAVAAVAKLRDPQATIDSFTQLGVPNPQATGRLIPLPELAIVVLLVVVPLVGGVAALVMLAFFTTFVVRRIAAGVRAPCNCFGDIGSRPLSWLAVVRNGVLMALAATALLTDRPVWPTVLDAVLVVGTTVIALTATMLAGDRVAARLEQRN